jgi:Tol biopolymer transport system component
MNRLVSRLALALTAGFTALLLAMPVVGAYLPQPDRLMYVSGRELQMVDVDFPHGLTWIRPLYDAAPGYVCCPQWSPDGRYIAFASSTTANAEIYVMSMAQKQPVRLTFNNSYDNFPVWSPDGTRIAFVSGRENNYQIYVMNADGSDQRRLTDGRDNLVGWSPDGQWLLYAHIMERQDLYVVSADGAHTRQLTTDLIDVLAPVWSPDGKTILFTSDYQGNFEIYSVQSDCSATPCRRLRLTDSAAVEGTPAWSPDGTRIVFTSNRHGNFEIYSMNPDGGDVQRLTRTRFDNVYPVWSPDGTHLAYFSNRTGRYEVYLMEARPGAPPHQITSGTSDKWGLTWWLRKG